MLEIIRLEQDKTQTVGVLKYHGKILCWTLEKPWKDNQRYVSCIPEGEYQAVRFASNRFGITFKIMTPNGEEPAPRDGILFHWGNTHVDTIGCILLGLEVGYLKDLRAVVGSKRAFERFIRTMGLVDNCKCIIRKGE